MMSVYMHNMCVHKVRVAFWVQGLHAGEHEQAAKTPLLAPSAFFDQGNSAFLAPVRILPSGLWLTFGRPADL